MMTNFLGRLGYVNLATLNDPRLILAKAANFKPDLILLDLHMPAIDGFQVIELLRKSDTESARVPIVVITGEANPANKRRALAAGATDLLSKPVDASEANMRINIVLEARFLHLEIENQNRLLEQRVSERTFQLQKALEDLQNAQKQMLQQERLSAFAEMAGGVVHDFSNALMAIIGYSDILIANDGKTLSEHDTTVEYLRIINTAGRDASQVVSRLRDFYRPRDEAHAFEVVNLQKVAEQAVQLTKPKWSRGSDARQSIRVETKLSEAPLVNGNASELREMLTNLIFNAVDAMPRGGCITLETSRKGSEAVLSVSDTGCGMTPEVRARCLDPFFSTKGENGTGLGLAMVFGIVKRHQGKITIESETDCGTTFRISVPSRCVDPQQKDDPLTADPTDTRRLVAA